MKVVYIDVVWLINVGMDFVILAAAGWMTRRKHRLWRLLAGALLGASYSLLLFVPGATGLTAGIGAKLLFSCLMVFVAFKPQNIVEFLRFCGLFYLASFGVGGTAYGINALFHNTQVLGGMVLVSGGALWNVNAGILLIICTVPVVYVLGKTAWSRMERMKHREGNLWNVSISIDGIQVDFTGLLDTGNALTDPLTRLPVAVVEWEALASVLPESLKRSFQENLDPTLSLGAMSVEEEWQSRLRIVPYRGVGGTMGMLLAFRPSEFVITQGETQHKVEKILIALNPRPISNEKAYQAILPPACLTETSVYQAS